MTRTQTLATELVQFEEMQAGSDMGRWWLTVTLSVSTRTGMVSMTYRSKKNHRQQRQELRYEMDGSNALAKAFVVAILFGALTNRQSLRESARITRVRE